MRPNADNGHRGLAAACGTAAVTLGLVGLALPASAVPPAPGGPPAAQAPETGVIPGAYVVTLAEGTAPEVVASEHGRRLGAEVDHVYRHALRGYAARMSPQAARRVAADPAVVAVEPDRVVTTAAQTVPTGVDRVDAELSSAAAGDGRGSVDVDVAVIDTGVDLDHPDLDVVGGRNCQRGRSYDDGNGHGTHVAGTIGALDDAAGVVGVAPGARIWAVRVLDNRGSGSWSSIICGIDWVTANASVIEVANMSLGGSGSDGACSADALHTAVCGSVAAGVTYVVAAGNSAVDAQGFVPATYAEVITVSALADFDGAPGGQGQATCRSDADDTFADFSNHGADVDLIAPGVCIASTWKDGGYSTISGTSMAAPHVAGAAALHKATNPGATPAQVRSALQGAGTLDWDARDDGDATKERLLSVAGS